MYFSQSNSLCKQIDNRCQHIASTYNCKLTIMRTTGNAISLTINSRFDSTSCDVQKFSKLECKTVILPALLVPECN
jgi:hypothetical protein